MTWKHWILWSLPALALALIWPRIFPYVLPQSLRTGLDAGQMYEALGAVFTLFAFIGVILTLQLQARDSARTTAELEEQGKDARHQKTRSELFQLLNAWQEIVHNTNYEDFTGRRAFHVMALNVSSAVNAHRTPENAALTIDQIEEAYEAFYGPITASQLNHYFRLLYHIVKFVNDAPVFSEKEKYELVRLVRAHLSEPELRLLFWNGLTHHGEHFRGLIDDYDLLQNFSFDDVQDGDVQHYPKTYARRGKVAKAKVESVI